MARKFGSVVHQPDPSPPSPVGDKWHLDEVLLTSPVRKHWLSRAVQTGIMLDVLVQRRRDKQAAKRLLRKLLKKQRRPPRVMITASLPATGRQSVRSCPASQKSSFSV
jgi:putative transposase